jgi:hypothetical protein
MNDTVSPQLTGFLKTSRSDSDMLYVGTQNVKQNYVLKYAIIGL